MTESFGISYNKRKLARLVFKKEMESLEIFHQNFSGDSAYSYQYIKDHPHIRALMINSMYQRSLRWEIFMDGAWRQRDLGFIIQNVSLEISKKMIYNLDILSRYSKD